MGQYPDSGVPGRAARLGWGGERGGLREFEPLLTRGLMPRNSFGNLMVPKASWLVIVHHSHGLHE